MELPEFLSKLDRRLDRLDERLISHDRKLIKHEYQVASVESFTAAAAKRLEEHGQVLDMVRGVGKAFGIAAALAALLIALGKLGVGFTPVEEKSKPQKEPRHERSRKSRTD